MIEVFDEIGIAPDRCDVAIQVLGGTAVYLMEDDAGTVPGLKISWATSPFGLTTSVSAFAKSSFASDSRLARAAGVSSSIAWGVGAGHSRSRDSSMRPRTSP